MKKCQKCESEAVLEMKVGLKPLGEGATTTLGIRPEGLEMIAYVCTAHALELGYAHMQNPAKGLVDDLMDQAEPTPASGSKRPTFH